MANERRMIDVDAAIERLKLEGVMRYPQSWGMGLLAAMETLRGFPTVDAVDVVRCRDCVYWTTDGNGYFEDKPHCGNPYGIEGYPKQDDFCSHGIRMSGTQPQREDIK